MEALNIAMPSDSIGSACFGPGMLAKVKTALMTLLLSTSDVPGTVGRETELRFDGHGNNCKFGPSSFFVMPNFADTYSLVVVQIHEGRGNWRRLDIRGGKVVRASGIKGAERIMPLLEHMQHIGAADSRARAEFFLLMTELHYRFLIDLERLHIGRMVLAQQGVTTQDEVAAWLQPCVAPGTIEVQAPFEAQGWGFVHGG